MEPTAISYREPNIAPCSRYSICVKALPLRVTTCQSWAVGVREVTAAILIEEPLCVVASLPYCLSSP